jgi:hypothetical protein
LPISEIIQEESKKNERYREKLKYKRELLQRPNNVLDLNKNNENKK